MGADLYTALPRDVRPDAPAGATAAAIQPAIMAQLLHAKECLVTALQADRSNYLEARAWLLADIAAMCPPGAHARGEAWRTLLPQPGDRLEGPSAMLLTQLLLLVSEHWPQQLGELLLDSPHAFTDFFAGSDMRILLWFSHFSMDGMRAFKYGAYALAHYCLAHREEAWDLLKWEGKHPQAPVSVAAKTHYFCELAIVPSVKALLAHMPFWRSDQWRACLGNGEFLSLDREYFASVLQREYEAGSSVGRALQGLLQRFAADGGVWQPLCHRLLHELPDARLLEFVNALSAVYPPPSLPHSGGGGGVRPAGGDASGSGRGGEGGSRHREHARGRNHRDGERDRDRGHVRERSLERDRERDRRHRSRSRSRDKHHRRHQGRDRDRSMDRSRERHRHRSRSRSRSRDRKRDSKRDREGDWGAWAPAPLPAAAAGDDGASISIMVDGAPDRSLSSLAGVAGAGWQDLGGLLLGGVRWDSVLDAVLCCSLASHRSALERLIKEAAEDDPHAAAALQDLADTSRQLHLVCGTQEGRDRRRGHVELLAGLTLMGRGADRDRLVLMLEAWTLRTALLTPVPEARATASAAVPAAEAAEQQQQHGEEEEEGGSKDTLAPLLLVSDTPQQRLVACIGALGLQHGRGSDAAPHMDQPLLQPPAEDALCPFSALGGAAASAGAVGTASCIGAGAGGMCLAPGAGAALPAATAAPQPLQQYEMLPDDPFSRSKRSSGGRKHGSQDKKRKRARKGHKGKKKRRNKGGKGRGVRGSGSSSDSSSGSGGSSSSPSSDDDDDGGAGHKSNSDGRSGSDSDGVSLGGHHGAGSWGSEGGEGRGHRRRRKSSSAYRGSKHRGAREQRRRGSSADGSGGEGGGRGGTGDSWWLQLPGAPAVHGDSAGVSDCITSYAAKVWVARLLGLGSTR